MRTITRAEPEFTDQERGLLLAYARYERNIGPHGQLLTEAMDPSADPNVPSPLRFIAGEPVRDWAEHARQVRIEKYQKENGEHADLRGLIFPVEKWQPPAKTPPVRGAHG
ncbi:hypothetical protein M2390_002924 [Mycetocola sp. BIGb0189]|uniref:hypothetical protein n=1 Tax=Mycetocola sp. BIGb0189 TaxID=2940604 RepID=UPI00216A2E68|nr:hypothetical protein [Mycetocola sp. BIGb0189]MCS4277715.1 hypothetical protein [Mycetocola sp. BIGb0189]